MTFSDNNVIDTSNIESESLSPQLFKHYPELFEIPKFIPPQDSLFKTKKTNITRDHSFSLISFLYPDDQLPDICDYLKSISIYQTHKVMGGEPDWFYWAELQGDWKDSANKKQGDTFLSNFKRDYLDHLKRQHYNSFAMEKAQKLSFYLRNFNSPLPLSESQKKLLLQHSRIWNSSLFPSHRFSPKNVNELDQFSLQMIRPPEQAEQYPIFHDDIPPEKEKYRRRNIKRLMRSFHSLCDYNTLITDLQTCKKSQSVLDVLFGSKCQSFSTKLNSCLVEREKFLSKLEEIQSFGEGTLNDIYLLKDGYSWHISSLKTLLDDSEDSNLEYEDPLDAPLDDLEMESNLDIFFVDKYPPRLTPDLEIESEI